MANVTINVRRRDIAVDFDACVNLMDDNLRGRASPERLLGKKSDIK